MILSDCRGQGTWDVRTWDPCIPPPGPATFTSGPQGGSTPPPPTATLPSQRRLRCLWSPQGMRVCGGCKQGYYNPNPGTPECSPCPAGSFSYFAQTGCLPCPKGWFTPFAGVSRCTQCRAGTYANAATNATHCKLCPSGYISNQGGGVVARCVCV